MDRFRIFLLALVLAAPVVWVAAIASAADDAVLLARIHVHESTWITPRGSNRDEADALYLVLADRAARNDWTLRQAMQAYSPRATGVWRARVSPRTRWVRTLDRGMRRPDGWPRGLDWERDFAPRWAARLAAAEAILASPPSWEGLCNAPPHHWGGAMDMRNPLLYGWLRVTCGRTHNWLWCAPARSPECRALQRGDTQKAL